MMGSLGEETAQDAWYDCEGLEGDVVLSTRVRLSRNLANFPFPSRIRGNDGERVQALVFDAFNCMEGGDAFRAIAVNRLDDLGARILRERGVLDDTPADASTGVILRTDGRVTCSVNIVDHVRISAFAAGMDFDAALALAQGVDAGLQKKLQFAASYDFGYLTSSLSDAGSGMRLSLRLHLPSLSMEGRIRSLSGELAEKGMLFTASFGSSGMSNVSGTGGLGSSLGSYYDVSGINSLAGSEFDQLASIASAGQRVRELERAARAECLQNMPSEVRNYVYRSVALARSSLFVPLREAITIISGVKWGRDMGLLTGVEDAALHALLYRIQEGHLQYVLKNGSFTFEPDISGNMVKKNERLRALILQEAFEGIKLAL